MDRNRMKYIALLRGINVGNSKRIDMKTLKTLFEGLSCSKVLTYINSGNVQFNTNETQDKIEEIIQRILKDSIGEDIKVLIKTKEQMMTIAEKIPNEWKNDEDQKTDVAYLFKSIDRKNIVDELPIKKEYINVLYVEGALIWNVKRKDYNKSQLKKIIGHKIYKEMTVRNVNTARYLGSW
jgi:uncharacterized protein (DUF1697 family)